MEFAEIKQLMREFSDLPITKLDLEWDKLKISLEKQVAGAVQTVDQPVTCQPITVVNQPPAVVLSDEDDCKARANETAVCSPVVGVYYSTPSPDAAPFVQVGQSVKKGQTLCIVEAMKMMNEIPAPVSGKITRILANSEEAVEFNQPLMFIQADE